MTEKIVEPEKIREDLLSRIERIQQYALENRRTVGSYSAFITPFVKQLRDQFTQEELDGVLSWHKLIGSTPWPNIPETEGAVRAEIDSEIEEFVSVVEELWLSGKESAEERTDLVKRIDRLYQHVAETKDLEKNAQFNNARDTVRRDLLALYPPDGNGVSQLKGIPAWEKLIGGGEINPTASPEVITDVTKRVEGLVQNLEQEWGL